MTFDGALWRLIGYLAEAAHLEKWASRDRWIVVVFHHIVDGVVYRADDPLVHGLKIDIGLNRFRSRLKWLADRYDFCSFDRIFDAKPGGSDRQKALLCFDDCYASTFHFAAPIMQELKVPWTFFINPGLVGNSRLAIDNIVAFIANTYGVEPLCSSATMPIAHPTDYITHFLSNFPPQRRRELVETLAADLGIDTESLAQSSRLYLEEQHLRLLAESGVEIGCHTLDHVHCRTLDRSNAATQIELSGDLLREMSGRPVRAFAYPYGSLLDGTAIARQAVYSAGHECAFVVQNLANYRTKDRYSLYRIDLGDADDSLAALRLEVLPRMRGALAKVRSIVGNSPHPPL